MFAVAAATGVEPPVWLTFEMIMRFPQRRVKHIREPSRQKDDRDNRLSLWNYLCENADPSQSDDLSATAPRRQLGNKRQQPRQDQKPEWRAAAEQQGGGDIRRLSRAEQSEANAALNSRPPYPSHIHRQQTFASDSNEDVSGAGWKMWNLTAESELHDIRS